MNEVICCVVVIRISLPSGVPVFSGSVTVPDASVPAGWIRTQSADVGVATAMLNPVPGV